MVKTILPTLDRSSHKSENGYCDKCEVAYPCDAERLFRYTDNLHLALDKSDLMAVPVNSPDNYEWYEDVPLQLVRTSSSPFFYGTSSLTSTKF